MEEVIKSDAVETIITCVGDIKDPKFPERFKSIIEELSSLICRDSDSGLLLVRKVEPWNSVRVTFSLGADAAERLRALAGQGGGEVLGRLGILSVQLRPAEVISIRVNQQPQQQQQVQQPQQQQQSTPVQVHHQLAESAIAGPSGRTPVQHHQQVVNAASQSQSQPLQTPPLQHQLPQPQVIIQPNRTQTSQQHIPAPQQQQSQLIQQQQIVTRMFTPYQAQGLQQSLVKQQQQVSAVVAAPAVVHHQQPQQQQVAPAVMAPKVVSHYPPPPYPGQGRTITVQQPQQQQISIPEIKAEPVESPLLVNLLQTNDGGVIANQPACGPVQNVLPATVPSPQVRPFVPQTAPQTVVHHRPVPPIPQQPPPATTPVIQSVTQQPSQASQQFMQMNHNHHNLRVQQPVQIPVVQPPGPVQPSVKCSVISNTLNDCTDVENQNPGPGPPFTNENENPVEENLEDQEFTSSGKKRQYLINPLTGVLEPMSCDSSSDSEPEVADSGVLNESHPQSMGSNPQDFPLSPQVRSEEEEDSTQQQQQQQQEEEQEEVRAAELKLRLKLDKCGPYRYTTTTTPEPRVPPLHISLRGRNAAVVTRCRERKREGKREPRRKPELPTSDIPPPISSYPSEAEVASILRSVPEVTTDEKKRKRNHGKNLITPLRPQLEDKRRKMISQSSSLLSKTSLVSSVSKLSGPGGGGGGAVAGKGTVAAQQDKAPTNPSSQANGSGANGTSQQSPQSQQQQPMSNQGGQQQLTNSSPEQSPVDQNPDGHFISNGRKEYQAKVSPSEKQSTPPYPIKRSPSEKQVLSGSGGGTNGGGGTGSGVISVVGGGVGGTVMGVPGAGGGLVDKAGDDSGIESMDALSEKSPNRGESPNRKDDCKKDKIKEEGRDEDDSTEEGTEDPVPIRLTPALYTYSNPDKQRDSPPDDICHVKSRDECYPSARSRSDSNPLNSSSGKSLLEQLLIEIPGDPLERRLGNQNSVTPITVVGRSMRNHRINTRSPDGVSESQTSVDCPTTGPKRGRKASESSNASHEDAPPATRASKRKCSENASELIKACIGADGTGINPVTDVSGDKAKIRKGDSSDEEESAEKRTAPEDPNRIRSVKDDEKYRTGGRRSVRQEVKRTTSATVVPPHRKRQRTEEILEVKGRRRASKEAK